MSRAFCPTTAMQDFAGPQDGCVGALHGFYRNACSFGNHDRLANVEAR